MRIDVITLFPEWIQQLASLGVTGRAISDGRVELVTWNPRDFTDDKHNQVDDRPYGGGPGMVMMAEPLTQTLHAVKQQGDTQALVSAMSPQGQVLNQAAIQQLAERQRLILLCGRYEGIDQRLLDTCVDEQWSLGDYVISGGELAAGILIDAVLRLQPGVLGHQQSAEQDSFSQDETTGYGLLDCPHYTRPEHWREQAVPEILLSGNHAAIADWRRQQALLATWKTRPELLTGATLTKKDQRLLAAALTEQESLKK